METVRTTRPQSPLRLGGRRFGSTAQADGRCFVGRTEKLGKGDWRRFVTVVGLAHRLALTTASGMGVGFQGNRGMG